MPSYLPALEWVLLLAFIPQSSGRGRQAGLGCSREGQHLESP